MKHLPYFLYRLHFATPIPPDIGQVTHVIAIDAVSAIETAVQYRGAGEYIAVIAVERLVQVDAVASSVLLELRAAESSRRAAGISVVESA